MLRNLITFLANQTHILVTPTIKLRQKILLTGLKQSIRGLREYQVRSIKSLHRHLILVLCAYSFIVWHQLTGGLRRRWANKPLNTFTDALSAFRTAISYRFIGWMQDNVDVFAAHIAGFGYVWA